MTKRQIKDALIMCSEIGNKSCKKCPYKGDAFCIKHLKIDAANAIEPECAVFDRLEEHDNFTVQVLINTKTGDVSVGRRKNK